jgi:hypothetical protein
VHIIDGTVGGALLLELFTRDGVGTMIARYNRTVFSMLAANEHSNLGSWVCKPLLAQYL